jgi:hypothetical protein
MDEILPVSRRFFRLNAARSRGRLRSQFFSFCGLAALWLKGFAVAVGFS